MHGDWTMGWMWLFWLSLILIVVWFVTRTIVPGAGGGPQQETAEEILKRRYANGDIDHDAYERMLTDLRK